MNKPCNPQEKIKIYNAQSEIAEEVNVICKTDKEWRSVLTAQQYDIMRKKGTEPAFSGHCPLPPKGESGIYQCAGCGTDLFYYDHKFESGTGWPSFWEPVSALNIRLEPDNSLGMADRTEVLCARCKAHLGHVFDDGPLPSGKRYCINAVVLKFKSAGRKPKIEKAVFAAGCFWGVESAFRQSLGKGVVSTRVGYTGGHFKNPTYEDVCANITGHAEAVEVEYDPQKISYQELLNIFWDIHDPTEINRQGPDVGLQYRSAIFFNTAEEEALAKKSRDDLDKTKKYKNKIVTEIVSMKEFFPAEDYHQRYYEKKGIKSGCPVGRR